MSTRIENVSRRDFLKTLGIVGGGLVVGVGLAGCSGHVGPAPMVPIEGDWRPNAFLQLTPDGRVLFYCPRDEIGQGVTTGLTTVVAEELDMDPSRIEVRLAGVHPDYVNPDFGIQSTGGSTSLKAHWQPLRQIGADTRAALLAAAAADLGVPVASLRTDDGHVVHGEDRMPYARFTARAATAPLPEGAALKSPSDFRWVGSTFPRLDGLAKSTGTAEFGIDADVPDLHRALVVHCPVAGGTVRTFDASAALAMPGVIGVHEISNGVGVVARKFWQAKQAAARVDVEWELPSLAEIDSPRMRADFEAARERDSGIRGAHHGDADGAITAAEQTLRQDYWGPLQAHAPMEPMNATVRVDGDHAEVWTGSQGPGVVRGLVARATGLPVENVTSHVAYLGGGFGRRATLPHVVEAAELAMATGKPVQVLWTREDDMRHGVYRPASLMRIEAGLDGEGRISGWKATRTGGTFMAEILQAALPGVVPRIPQGLVDFAAGTADWAVQHFVADGASLEGLEADYDFDDLEVRHVTMDHGLPLTFWRSVGHSTNAFAKEVAIDELAAMAGADPVDFRLAHLRRNPRVAQVVRIAGEQMQQMGQAPDRFLGFAAHSSFGSSVAEVAEISITDGRIRVHKVLCVVDCGRAVNPDIVRAQMEGAVMFGLTATLHGQIELDGGAVVQSNFHDYPILRMDESPEIEVIIIDSDDDPSGVGEPGVPPIAPAVANAVFAATGKRLRDLPLALA